MQGEGVLKYWDDSYFEGIFDSKKQTANGFLRDKDGELVYQWRDRDFSYYYR